MRLPSVETLDRAFPTPDSDKQQRARAIRSLMESCRDELLSPLKALKGIDAILGGHGVEHIYATNDVYCRRGIDYVNMGDTYDMTVMYDCATDRFAVDSWGNVVERAPRSRYE